MGLLPQGINISEFKWSKELERLCIIITISIGILCVIWFKWLPEGVSEAKTICVDLGRTNRIETRFVESCEVKYGDIWLDADYWQAEYQVEHLRSLANKK